MRPACGRRAAARLLSFPRPGSGMCDIISSHEIELSHMGKNNGNLKLVCEKSCFADTIARNVQICNLCKIVQVSYLYVSRSCTSLQPGNHQFSISFQ